MEDIEEVILALKAAGHSMPQYEVLPDGSYHFFYGPKDTNSLIPSGQSGAEDARN
jgi:hypothetical protein